MEEKTRVSEELVGKEIMDDELEGAVGGRAKASAKSDDNQYTIKVSYSAMTTRAEVRRTLISKMNALGIPTDKVPDMYTLWRQGMTFGPQGGTLIYECKGDGSMFRYYQG